MTEYYVCSLDILTHIDKNTPYRYVYIANLQGHQLLCHIDFFGSIIPLVLIADIDSNDLLILSLKCEQITKYSIDSFQPF